MPVEATDALNLVAALSTWGRTKYQIKGQESMLNLENKTLRKIDSLQNIISHLKLESIEKTINHFLSCYCLSYSDLGLIAYFIKLF